MATRLMNGASRLMNRTSFVITLVLTVGDERTELLPLVRLGVVSSIFRRPRGLNQGPVH
jgi:hypothetical protein